MTPNWKSIGCLLIGCGCSLAIGLVALAVVPSIHISGSIGLLAYGAMVSIVTSGMLLSAMLGFAYAKKYDGDFTGSKSAEK